MATRPPRPYVIKAVSAFHTLIYRLTRGRLGGRIDSLPILLLTTRGRKSGRRRTTPLVYLRDGEELVLIASYGGRDEQPAWFWNLESNPQAQVQIGGRPIPMLARKATSDERVILWPKVLQLWPGYAKYQERTSRTIPLIILSPA